MATTSFWTRPAHVRRAGFTVIELLVVCAIIVVITSLVLVNNNKFGGDVTLENFAYDVALSVRQAQVFGIAVERFGTGCTGSGSTGNTNCFNSGYGMNFSLSDPTHYVLFADLPGAPLAGVFDAAYPITTQYPNGEVQEQSTIKQGYKLSSLCVEASSGATCTAASQIDILYIRPQPDAYISAKVNGVEYSCYVGVQTQHPEYCYYEAQITLVSPKGDTRTVDVDATGQISVQLQ